MGLTVNADPVLIESTGHAEYTGPTAEVAQTTGGPESTGHVGYDGPLPDQAVTTEQPYPTDPTGNRPNPPEVTTVKVAWLPGDAPQGDADDTEDDSGTDEGGEGEKTAKVVTAPEEDKPNTSDAEVTTK